MKASRLRQLTQILPLPNSIMSWIIKYTHITYPEIPIVVPAKGGFANFEIQDAQEFIQSYIYFRGFYEFRETRILRQYLRDGDVFIDVGANLGWFTLVAASIVGTKGKVIAFEPSSSIYAHLKKNVEINLFDNIKLEKLALSDKNGTVKFQINSNENRGLGSIVLTENVDKVVEIEKVKTLKFDDYYQDCNLDKIRFMKIDVEGAEMMVLQGMSGILQNKACDYLMVEVSDDRLREIGSSSADVLTLLRDYGYRLFHINLFQTKPLEASENVSFANILAEATR